MVGFFFIFGACVNSLSFVVVRSFFVCFDLTFTAQVVVTLYCDVMYYSNAVIGASRTTYSIFNSDTHFYHFGVVGKTEQVTYLAKSVSMNSVALGGHSEKTWRD